MKVNVNNLIVPLKVNQNKHLLGLLEKMGIGKSDVERIDYMKRSIDSRKKSDIKLVYNIQVTLKEGSKIPDSPQINLAKEDKRIEKKAVYPKNSRIGIIGTGPAGLFAAYRLSQLGYSPLIFERGEMVDERDRSIQKFISQGILNGDSNIQFGEGGAGTYSDGKLNTRIKSGYIDEVFQILVECGAQEEILWDYKPHIGTDVLKVVVKNLREKIKSMGGKFYFSHKLEDVMVQDGRVAAIDIKNSEGGMERIPLDYLLLATGHSARETYRMLHKKGVAMENKPFAVGARIEHSREFIDRMMFGESAGDEKLGTATYTLTHNNRAEERGIFSFCMCPGGVIVNAASEEGGTLVNGMSYSDRMGKYSNSALVVAVKAHEMGEHLFSGMEFQEKLEKKAYQMAGYGGVYQNSEDFVKGVKSKKISGSSYEMELHSGDLNELLPEFVTENMKSALTYWNKIHRGFMGREANLIGPETRTSAPVQITRDLKGESVTLRGLYPIGEGAGYAGGITSAAVDGLKVVDLSFSFEVQ
ncbi:MAG: NAD(P)/FAD-dependent oxidoreductase [Fusobacteriaceae bacterium]